MSREDLEKLRADVVSAHRLIELMGEEKEALGERVEELEQGAFSREWSNKLLVVEERAAQLKEMLIAHLNNPLARPHEMQDKLEALHTRVSDFHSHLGREWNELGKIEQRLRDVEQWIEQGFGKPPTEKSEADMGIEMLWPEEGEKNG